MAKKAAKKKHAGGRPTKYKAEYCKGIVTYFNIKPTKQDGKGNKLVANDLRFLSQYARKIDVTHDTLLEWCKVHPRFSVAYKKAKEMQKEHLITCGLLGLYNPTAFIFTAKNIAGMKDKTETEHSGEVGIKGLLSDIDGNTRGLPGE